MPQGLPGDNRVRPAWCNKSYVIVCRGQRSSAVLSILDFASVVYPRQIPGREPCKVDAPLDVDYVDLVSRNESTRNFGESE